MADKIYAVRGKAQNPGFGGAFTGIGLPFLKFELASEPNEAIERLSRAMIEEDRAWFKKVDDSPTDDIRHIGPEPSIPFSVENWTAVEVHIPGYEIKVEKL
ncbi:MAG: hypothetical protein ACYCY6_00760 [Minisyncoccota bacterium]